MLGKFWKKLLKRKGLTDEKTKQDTLEYNNTPPSKEKHISRSKKSKKVIDCFFALFIFCTVLFGGTVNNATTVQAANFPSKVVNIGGYITLQGSYSVSVWRSGNTVYCKVHVDVSAPNGAYQSMGASMSTNHGSTSKTFVGDGGATPKRGSGDIQISFADSGAGTISGTIYAGFTRYLNSTYALTANFSTSYPTSNIDSTVPKNNASGNITYVSHVENIGWQSWVADGATSGTVGKKLQMETIAIDSKLVGLSYEVHVAEKGWMSAKTNGHAAGTIGQSLAIQAIKIKLTGNNATRYTLKYRAHVAEKGWMNWVNAGEVAGTTGQSLDMQAIEIKLIPNTYTLKITGDSGVESISGNGSYSAGSTASSTYKIKTGYHMTSLVGQGPDAGQTWTGYNNKMGTLNDTWYMSRNRQAYINTAKNTVSIAYHINGGTVNSSTYSINQYGYVQNSSGPWFHKISYGSSDDLYNASTFGLTKTGYSFIGWENSNTGTFYDQDTQYGSAQYYGKSTSDTTETAASVDCYLKAKWKINTYTVSINPNGGSYNGTTGITKINQAQGKTVEINQIPTRKGYTFVGWTRSGSGSLHSGNSDNRSGITQYEKADADGTAYTNYKMNFNNTTNAGYAYPSIQYFSYGYTSGHTYRLSVDVRVNKSSGNEYAHIRHSAFVNNWVAPSTTVNYLTNGWEHRTVERTFTGTTSEQNGTSQNTYPFVEFYAGIAGGKTGILDFDMKNLTIYDVTAGEYVSSNYESIKNGATVDVGKGDTTITAVWVPNNTIYYKAGKGGAVSRTSEPVEGYKDALGSYARVNTGYKFDGWYGSGVKVSSNANFVPGNPNNSLEQPLRSGNYGGEVLSYDSTNKIYTIKANASNMNSSWGSGVSPSIASNDIIPWGKYFTATFDVWSPIDAKIQVDINNATVDGVNASGNDNDTNRGGTTAISLKANTWTTVSFWYQNASSTNSSQAALRNYSSIGLIWDTSKGDQNFKIRNYQTMVSNNVVGSAREYEARFVPIPYQQTVRVRFENTDGSFTNYSQAYQANHNYDSTFEWEFPASQQYQSAKVSYKVTGAKSTDVTVYRKKYTVKALARYQNKDGSWPSEYKEEYNKTYRYGEECPDYPKFVNTASDYSSIVSWKAFTVTEDKVMKFDLALDKGSVTVKVYLNGVRKELDNDYFKFDYYVENKLIASQVNSVEDKKSFYKSNFIIKNITPIPGYHYDNKYVQKSWMPIPPVENNTGIIDGVLNKDSGNKYILYISANQYTISYNPNKGSGSMSPDTVTYNTAYKTKKNTFTRTGYTFNGWNEKADGTGTAWSLSSSGVYEANKTWTWTYTHDITLYAQWKPNSYTYNIKYVSSSGRQLGSDTVTGTFDTSKTVTPPAKTGYTTPASQTVKFDSTSAKTITFTYQLINYSISYDVNGGTALSGQRTSYNIESSAYTLPTPSKTGHTFTGWTGSNGTAPQKSVTIAAGSTGNKSYKANWTINSYTNTISHWAGGFKNQEGNNSSKSWFALRTTTFNKNYGETFSMNDSLATAIPNGFYLMGKFGTSSLEGTWKTYEKPYSITQPAKDMSFEYDYYPYDYSITYNLDSGTNNSANPSKYNVLYGVSLKNPTKTGYTFLGWYDNVNLIINKKYEIASDTTVNGNNYVFKNTTNGNTLNAFQIQTWKDGTYLETFAGGSQTGTRQEKYTHNRDTGNYTIRLKANGSTKDSSVYYYDVYLEKGKTYSISYNIEKCTSSEVVVKNLLFTRSDNVTGINEGANATFTSSDELYAKLKNRQTGNINLTAKWTPNEYTLTLNPNGGNIKGNTNAQSLNPSLYYDRGNWWYVGSMSPSRAGYSFSGWFDAPSGGIKVYDSEGNCTNDGKYWKNKQYKYLGNLTVYAQWTPNSYTYNIKYVSSSNKSLGSDTVTGIFDTSKTVTPPDKTGYTTPAAQTVKFDSTSAKTIMFIYQLINYSISYDVNGGTALSGQRTSYNIESSAYTLPVPSRIGYTFTGWTGSNGTTPQKSVTIAAGSTGNKSYKANWEANSLTIRYHSNGAFGGNIARTGTWENNVVLDYEQSKDIVVSTERYKEGAHNAGLKQYGISDYDGKMNDHVYLYKNGYIGTSKYNTSPNGSGIEINENKTFNSVIELANYLGKSIDSKDNSIDLYPQWKAISYSIAYNGNGATSGSMSEQPATFDKNGELTPNSFSRKYTVTYNATGGTVNAPNNVATSTFNGWEDRGNITFIDKNYSYNEFDAPYYSQNYTDLNTAFGFNKYDLIKHYFLYGKSEGRNTKDKAGNAGLYPNKATVKNLTTTNGYKVNLYASWKLGSVTLPTPTRFGYKFLGWYTSAEGGTKISGTTYTPTSNVTLYAHWKLDSYYIDYNVNDAGLTDHITDNLPDNNGSLPGKDTAIMLTDFALQNGSKYNTKYTFKEWNTKPDGSGKKFTTSITNDGSLCKPGETLTLYAIWDTTPTITGKDFYMLENMKPASDILTSGKGLDKNPIDHFPDNMKDVAYPVKGYTKNGTDISSRIKVDYVEFDNSKTATASIDTKKPGKYTVHYSLTDGKQSKKFTRTITVLSASTPVINAGDRYFNKGSFVTAEMLLSTITSGDRYDGDLTNKVAVLNMEQIAFNTVGNYELQYKVTNRSGKVVVKKVKVHILEYLTDNQADKDNKYRYIRKDCSTKNDYCMEYFKEDSKWVTNDELNNQIIDSLSKDKSEEAIKKYHFSQDDVERSKQLQ